MSCPLAHSWIRVDEIGFPEQCSVGEFFSKHCLRYYFTSLFISLHELKLLFSFGFFFFPLFFSLISVCYHQILFRTDSPLLLWSSASYKLIMILIKSLSLAFFAVILVFVQIRIIFQFVIITPANVRKFSAKSIVF